MDAEALGVSYSKSIANGSGVVGAVKMYSDLRCEVSGKVCLRIGTWDLLLCCARSTRHAQLLYCLLCSHQPCLDLFQSSLSHLLQLPSVTSSRVPSVISSSSSLMLSTVSIACPSPRNSSCKFLPSSWKQHLLETEGKGCLFFSGCPMGHG